MGGCPSAPGNLSTGSKNPGNLSSGRRQAAEKFLGIAQQEWDRLPEAVKTKDVVRLSLSRILHQFLRFPGSFSSSSLFTVESQIHFASQSAGVIRWVSLIGSGSLDSQNITPQFLVSEEHFRSPGSGTLWNPRNVSLPRIRNFLDPRNGDFLESQEHFASQDGTL